MISYTMKFVQAIAAPSGLSYGQLFSAVLQFFFNVVDVKDSFKGQKLLRSFHTALVCPLGLMKEKRAGVVGERKNLQSTKSAGEL